MADFWKELGAYETENNKMYLDLEGIFFFFVMVKHKKNGNEKSYGRIYFTLQQNFGCYLKAGRIKARAYFSTTKSRRNFYRERMKKCVIGAILLRYNLNHRGNPYEDFFI